jgi:hypothetical protein
VKLVELFADTFILRDEQWESSCQLLSPHRCESMSAEAECVTKALALRTQSGSREQAQSGSLAVAFVSTAFAERAAGRFGMVCFLFPLIEPDRRISRIRLSEKVSRFRPRKAAGPSSKFDKAQHLMQGSNGKLLSCLPSQFVPGAQPLSQPLASMSFDSEVTAKTAYPVAGLTPPWAGRPCPNLNRNRPA